jgi:hypothetical protein
MVDELAKVYQVETYDRQDLLRVVVGHIGVRVLFRQDVPLYAYGRSAASGSRSGLLMWLGSSVADYFRAWSAALISSRGPAGTAPGCDWRILAPTRQHRLNQPSPYLCQKSGYRTMPKLTFYPVGNADTFVIDLSGGEKIIFDYADRRNRSDKDDKRCNLPAELRKDLGSRTYYDVAVFTHLDEDHYDGMTDFFYLEHDKASQGKAPDGKDRIKMTEMWVPAAVLTEKVEKEKESRDVQNEAWHRLKNKKGILVFSRPDSLKEAIEKKGIKYDEVKHLIIDAGKTVPSFTQDKHGVEFWVHSPHAHIQNEDEEVCRNDHGLVLLAAFKTDGVETKVQLFADVKHEVIADIVAVTKKKRNEARLEWHVFKTSHHCSYKSLGPEKGKTKTEPVDEVKWLFEDQGQAGGIIISTSFPIPSNDDVNDPPHRQAAKYYREVADDKDGEFWVTMEHPKVSDPKPLVVEITKAGAAVREENVQAAAAKSLTEAIAAARGAAEPPQTRVGFGQ